MMLIIGAATWAAGYLVTVRMLFHDWWNGVDWWHEVPKDECKCEVCERQRMYDRAYNEKYGHLDGYGGIKRRKESPAVSPLSYDHFIGFMILCLVAWPILFFIEFQTRATAAQRKHMEYLKRMQRPIEDVAAELNQMLRDEGADEIRLPVKGPLKEKSNS